MLDFTQTTQLNGSTDPHLSIVRGGIPLDNRVQINDSTYAIVAAGEVFSLSYDFGAGGGPPNWNGDEVMRTFLFTSTAGVNGDTVVGDIMELGGDNYSIDRAGDGQWTTRDVPTFYTTTASDVGKTVYFGQAFENPTGNALFPRIDVIQLEVNK